MPSDIYAAANYRVHLMGVHGVRGLQLGHYTPPQTSSAISTTSASLALVSS